MSNILKQTVMKPKKTPKADLNSKRGLFFQIGLSASLLTAILFFSWSQPAVTVAAIDIQPGGDVFDLPPVTIDEPERVEPRRIEVRAADILRIVSDHQRIEHTFDFTEAFGDPFVFVPATTGGREEDPSDENEIFVIVEDQPLFQGRSANTFAAWTMRNVVYPAIALENGIQGKVTVSFVIERDGSLSDVQVLASPDRSLSEETLRVIRNSPNDWTPGKQRNNPVRVRYQMEIVYKMQ